MIDHKIANTLPNNACSLDTFFGRSKVSKHEIKINPYVPFTLTKSLCWLTNFMSIFHEVTLWIQLSRVWRTRKLNWPDWGKVNVVDFCREGKESAWFFHTWDGGSVIEQECAATWCGQIAWWMEAYDPAKNLLLFSGWFRTGEIFHVLWLTVLFQRGDLAGKRIISVWGGCQPSLWSEWWRVDQLSSWPRGQSFEISLGPYLIIVSDSLHISPLFFNAIYQIRWPWNLIPSPGSC